LRKKLATDGVSLATGDAIESGLCVNEAERDLTYRVELKRNYNPDPGVPLMHNPFHVEKKAKK